MLNAKINVNGVEWNLTGDKEDIVYALRNATVSSIPTVNDREIIRKINTEIPTNTVPEKQSVYSKDDMIKMYRYLATQGDFRIQQFEITRGGKTNPSQYTVCLVFDNARQRYCYYNPKTEDRFIKTFTVEEVINRLNNSESGFSLLHTISNKIWERVNVIDGLSKIVNSTPYQPNMDVNFKNYEPKVSFMNGIRKVMKPNEWVSSNQIWERMKRIGFSSKGKTPENTIASMIYVDIKNRGTDSAFERESGKQSFRLKA